MPMPMKKKDSEMKTIMEVLAISLLLVVLYFIGDAVLVIMSQVLK